MRRSTDKFSQMNAILNETDSEDDNAAIGLSTLGDIPTDTISPETDTFKPPWFNETTAKDAAKKGSNNWEDLFKNDSKKAAKKAAISGTTVQWNDLQIKDIISPAASSEPIAVKSKSRIAPGTDEKDEDSSSSGDEEEEDEDSESESEDESSYESVYTEVDILEEVSRLEAYQKEVEYSVSPSVASASASPSTELKSSFESKRKKMLSKKKKAPMALSTIEERLAASEHNSDADGSDNNGFSFGRRKPSLPKRRKLSFRPSVAGVNEEEEVAAASRLGERRHSDSSEQRSPSPPSVLLQKLRPRIGDSSSHQQMGASFGDVEMADGNSVATQSSTSLSDTILLPKATPSQGKSISDAVNGLSRLFGRSTDLAEDCKDFSQPMSDRFSSDQFSAKSATKNATMDEVPFGVGIGNDTVAIGTDAMDVDLDNASGTANTIRRGRMRRCVMQQSSELSQSLDENMRALKQVLPSPAPVQSDEIVNEQLDAFEFDIDDDEEEEEEFAEGSFHEEATGRRKKRAKVKLKTKAKPKSRAKAKVSKKTTKSSKRKATAILAEENDESADESVKQSLAESSSPTRRRRSTRLAIKAKSRANDSQLEDESPKRKSTRSRGKASKKSKAEAKKAVSSKTSKAKSSKSKAASKKKMVAKSRRGASINSKKAQETDDAFESDDDAEHESEDSGLQLSNDSIEYVAESKRKRGVLKKRGAKKKEMGVEKSKKWKAKKSRHSTDFDEVPLEMDLSPSPRPELQTTFASDLSPIRSSQISAVDTSQALDETLGDATMDQSEDFGIGASQHLADGTFEFDEDVSMRDSVSVPPMLESVDDSMSYSPPPPPQISGRLSDGSAEDSGEATSKRMDAAKMKGEMNEKKKKKKKASERRRLKSRRQRDSYESVDGSVVSDSLSIDGSVDSELIDADLDELPSVTQKQKDGGRKKQGKAKRKKKVILYKGKRKGAAKKKKRKKVKNAEKEEANSPVPTGKKAKTAAKSKAKSKKSRGSRKRKKSEAQSSDLDTAAARAMHQLVVIPEDASQLGVRRSKRVRFQPLKYWVNERIEPTREILTKATVKQRLREGELFGSDAEGDWHDFTRKKAYAKKKGKGKRKKKRGKEEASDLIASDIDSDDDGGHFKDFDGMAMIYDPFRDELKQAHVCQPRCKVNMIVLNQTRPKGAPATARLKTVRGARALEETDQFTCGFVEIPPDSVKYPESTQYTEVFTVISAQPLCLEVEVSEVRDAADLEFFGDDNNNSVHTKKFLLSKASVFYVLPENTYAFRNLSKTHKVTLSFVLILSVPKGSQYDTSSLGSSSLSPQ